MDSEAAWKSELSGAAAEDEVGLAGARSGTRRSHEQVLILKRLAADLVFIASGLGGGSGTGICPIVAEEAKAAGALVVGIVTTPFHVERRQRMARALEGLESLRRCADAVPAQVVLSTHRSPPAVPPELGKHAACLAGSCLRGFSYAWGNPRPRALQRALPK